MLWMEIQEGKVRMRSKPHFAELGATSSCVLRARNAGDAFQRVGMEDAMDDEPTQYPLRYDGDSWFGSVKSAAAVGKKGDHACMIVKTAHSRCPKKWLEEKMKDFPGGTWIVLEGRASPEGVDLVCLGYKYNKKKVLTFVLTRGCGSTAPGKPYEAKFPDQYGNICYRDVARPTVLSSFFESSNAVDRHNQARQSCLALEKAWITKDGYFRLFTTIIGMCVTDAWKISNGNKQGGEEESIRSIRYFSDKLAYELLHRGALLMAEDDNNSLPPPPPVQISQAATSGDATQTSSVSYSSVEGHGVIIRHPHTQIVLEKKVSNIAICLRGSRGRIRRNQYTSQIRCLWCSRVNGKDKKTTLKCLECGVGFCKDQTGRMCWSLHVALNGPPKQPKRKHNN
jgi:hypothetical protein